MSFSLDYLVGNSDLQLDQVVIKRIENIQKLKEEDKNHLFFIMDAFLRDAKTRQAYMV